MDGKIYVNGAITAPHEARIAVLDRGFLYGDSVFETMRVYARQPFALGEHLRRLAASGEHLGFVLPWSPAALRTAIAQTVAQTGMTDLYLRVIATRGSGPLSLDPATATCPTLVVMAMPLPPLPAVMYEHGRRAWLVSQTRHGQRGVDPLAKTGNYVGSVLAAREAQAHGAEEAIMQNPQGQVAEASAANVFAWIDGAWCTPPLEAGILSGITRQTLLRLCLAHAIPCAEAVLMPNELLAASEIFLCASIRELVPVVQVNGQPVGNGQVGPQTRRLHHLYRQHVAQATAEAGSTDAL